MADFDSSLPIRPEADGDVVINLSDPNTPANKVAVEADGSLNVNATIPAGEKIIVTDGTDDLEINADGSLNAVVTATDLDIRDLDASTDSVAAHLFDEAGVAFSASNPLPVELSPQQGGAPVVDYQTSSSVAAAASVNHDYTVTAATTFIGEELWASGSGKLKVEVLVDSATVFVGFNSTANPNVRIPLDKVVTADASEVVRITLTNLDKQPQDLYSTLTGSEV
jgi:hypothetical protein